MNCGCIVYDLNNYKNELFQKNAYEIWRNQFNTFISYLCPKCLCQVNKNEMAKLLNISQEELDRYIQLSYQEKMKTLCLFCGKSITGEMNKLRMADNHLWHQQCLNQDNLKKIKCKKCVEYFESGKKTESNQMELYKKYFPPNQNQTSICPSSMELNMSSINKSLYQVNSQTTIYNNINRNLGICNWCSSKKPFAVLNCQHNYCIDCIYKLMNGQSRYNLSNIFYCKLCKANKANVVICILN